MNNLPQFYRQPVAFDTALHGSLQFPDVAPDFLFAAKADVIALQVSEVAWAVRDYPMVFVSGPDDTSPSLAALVGLGDGVNRYVNAQGQWRANAYIPAYVRRYPFLPMLVEGKADPILAIDLSEDWVHAKTGAQLVDSDGNATPRLDAVMAFQREYQAQADRTQAMCAALHAAGVLEQRKLTWQHGDGGETRQLDGFWCVEESKLRALSADKLLALHEVDALGLAYAQLMSLSHLQNLVAAPTRATSTETKTPKGKKVSADKK